ncbi:MAG: hypothetical protein ACUZ8H_10040 [Candidatus Anammoxibacter sp.]
MIKSDSSTATLRNGNASVGTSVENKARKKSAAIPLFKKVSTKDKQLRKDRKIESDIEDLVIEGRQKIDSYEEIKDITIPLTELSSADVKEFLKEKIGNLTIEGTIHEMYATIKGMETQLINVLDINASLEKDLKMTKGALLNGNKVKKELENKLKASENEGPSKIELGRELRELISQYNVKQEEIQDVKNEKDTIGGKVDGLNREIERLSEEKDDLVTDASILRAKMDDLVFKIKESDALMKKTGKENVEFKKDIKNKEIEISGLKDENTSIRLEFNESDSAFNEIYNSLVAASDKTKKFFSQEAIKQTVTEEQGK